VSLDLPICCVIRLLLQAAEEVSDDTGETTEHLDDQRWMGGRQVVTSQG
jgi:hypothetical protein